MSHDLHYNEQTKKHSLFVARELAWHRLGTFVNHSLTSKEAIEAAQLDFKVKKGVGYVKRDLEDIERLGKGCIVDNTYFTYRDDIGTVLCSDGHAVTKDYTVIQNVEAFDFFDSIVGDQLAIFETAGALRKGETVFVTAKFPEEVVLSKQDKINQYLLFTLNHNGTASIQIKFTPIRVVCNNTLTAALYGKGGVNIRHSKSYKDKLEIAKSVLGLEKTVRLQLAETANAFIETKVETEQMIQLVCKVFLTKEELDVVSRCNFKYENNDIVSARKANIINAVLDYTYYGIGQDSDTCDNNLWTFVNGITGYYQNSRDYVTNGNDDAERKFNSLNYGEAATRSQAAFNVAKEFELVNN